MYVVWCLCDLQCNKWCIHFVLTDYRKLCLWVWNFVSPIKGWTCAQGVSDQAGEEDGRRSRSLEKFTQWVVLWFVILARFCFSEWGGVGNVTCMDRCMQGFGQDTWSRASIWETRCTGRWEHINKMNFKEITRHGIKWTNMAYDSDHWWAMVDEIM